MRPYPTELKKKILANKDAIIDQFGQEQFDIWSEKRPEKKDLASLEILFSKIENKAVATAQEEK